MTLLTYTQPHILIADEGFNLKSKKDTANPYYFSLAFMPDDVTSAYAEKQFDEVAITSINKV